MPKTTRARIAWRFAMVAICALVILTLSYGRSLARAPLPFVELTFGASLSGHSGFGYDKLVVAPFWGLNESGIRIRAMGGLGYYPAWGGVAETHLVDLMVGYAHYRGRWGATWFVGPTYDAHDTPDPLASKSGQTFGLAALVEPYWHLTDRILLSGWASWRSPHDGAEAALAASYRFGDRFTAKGEITYIRDEDYEALRVLAGIGHRRGPAVTVWLLAGIENPRSGDDGTGFAGRLELVVRPAYVIDRLR